MNGRGFSDREKHLIAEMFSCCGCGGNLYPYGHQRARSRCPECRSNRLRKVPYAAID